MASAPNASNLLHLPASASVGVSQEKDLVGRRNCRLGYLSAYVTGLPMWAF